MLFITSPTDLQPRNMTITQYSPKRKYSEDVFGLLHTAPIETRPDVACWLSECVSPAVPRKHRRVLEDISHKHNLRCRQQSTMSNTFRRQRKTADEGTRTPRSRTQQTARVGSALTLRSTKTKSIAEDEDPTPLKDDATVASDFDTISEAPSLLPPTTVSSMTSRSPTRTRSSSPKKRTVTKREDLAYLSPRIEFKAMRQAGSLGISLPESVRALWDRCEACW